MRKARGSWDLPRACWSGWAGLEGRLVLELAGVRRAAVGLAGGALGLGGRPAQAGADLLGGDLDHGALLALGRLPAPHPQLPDDHHAVALAEGVGDVGRQVPPGGDAVEGGVAVAPG